MRRFTLLAFLGIILTLLGIEWMSDTSVALSPRMDEVRVVAPTLEAEPNVVNRDAQATPSASLRIEFSDGQLGRVGGFEVLLLPPLAEGHDWHSFRTWNFFSDTPDFTSRKGLPALEPEVFEKFVLQREQAFRKKLRSLGLGDVFVAATVDGAITWRKQVGRDGVVEWTDLPAGVGYRWAVVHGRGVTMNPRHEKDAARNATANLRELRSPDNLSGLFDLPAGEPVRLEVQVHRSSGVRGVCIGKLPEFEEAPIIRIDTAQVFQRKKGAPIRRWKSVYRGRADKLGRFEVDGLAPGDYMLRVRWAEGSDGFAVLSRSFVMPESGFVDLGGLMPALGEALTCVVRCVDRTTRQPIALSAVFPPGDIRLPSAAGGTTGPKSSEGIAVNVRINSKIDPKTLHGWIAEKVQVPVGKKFTFWGVNAAKAWIQVSMGASGASWNGRYRLVTCENVAADLPARETVEVPIVLERAASAEVRLTSTQGLGRVRVVLQNVDSGEFFKDEWRMGDQREAAVHMQIPTGTYRSFAATPGLPDDGGKCVFGPTFEVENHAGSISAIALHLQPATRVAGRIRPGASGTSRMLFFSVPDWPSAPLWSARVAKDGSFEVVDLPVDQTIKVIGLTGPAEVALGLVKREGRWFFDHSSLDD